MLEHATVPYVLDGDGNCHVYVDATADLDMALGIIVNAKTSRPGVCNAAETLLVHRGVSTGSSPCSTGHWRPSSCGGDRGGARSHPARARGDRDD